VLRDRGASVQEARGQPGGAGGALRLPGAPAHYGTPTCLVLPLCAGALPVAAVKAVEVKRTRVAAALRAQVGDRYFTDVVYGNQSGMLTIRVAPFTDKGETVVVKAVRALEDWVVNLWRNGGVRAASHPLVQNQRELDALFSCNENTDSGRR
jgi:hypothetical protein